MADIRITAAALDILGKVYSPGTVTPGYIPAGLDMLAHDWSDACQVRVAWQTDVQISEAVLEDRRSLTDRPRRTLRVACKALGQANIARAYAWMHRLQQGPTIAPLHADRTLTTAPLTIGATVVPADLTGRRFFVGGLVVLASLDRTFGFAALEVGRIAAVGAGTITLAAPLGMAWPAGTRLYPLLEVQQRLESSMQPLTDQHGQLVVELPEIVGPSALPSQLGPWALPPGEATYRQHPIFPFRPNFAAAVDMSSRRAGEEYGSGRATVVQTQGERPRNGLAFEVLCTTRTDAARLMRFLDHARGRTRPFWVRGPISPWRVVSVSGNVVEIEAVGSRDDAQRYFPFVSLTLPSGEVLIRQVREVEQPPLLMTRFRLHLEEELPSDALAPQRVQPAYLVRLESDEYVEEWLTLEVMTVRLGLIEVTDERRAPLIRRSKPLEEFAPTFNGTIGMFLSPQGLLGTSGSPLTGDGGGVATWTDFFASANTLVTAIPPEQARYTRQTMGPRVNLRAADIGGAGEKSSLRWGGTEPIYDNARGLTVVMAVQQRANPTATRVDDFLLGFANEANTGADKLIWTPTSMLAFEDAGLVDLDFQSITPDVLFPHGAWHVIALRWLPGQHLMVWRDGDLAGQTPRAPMDIPVGVSQAARQARFLRLANDSGSGATPAAGDTAVNAVAVYGRALHDRELDAIGAFLAGRVGTTWRRVLP